MLLKPSLHLCGLFDGPDVGRSIELLLYSMEGVLYRLAQVEDRLWLLE